MANFGACAPWKALLTPRQMPTAVHAGFVSSGITPALNKLRI
jgi:hypothetical protein